MVSGWLGGGAGPADTDYLYRYLPSHLADAGDRETLNALLLDPGWLQAKLTATSSPPDPRRRLRAAWPGFDA